MLVAAAEQIERSGTRAGNQIAYCIREALMSLLELGGTPERDVARLAARQDVPTVERVERLTALPASLFGRMIAAHLAETIDMDAAAALALIADQVANHDPMPETLALLGELTRRELPDLDQRMLRAAGRRATEGSR
jgi:hypothetical protein